MFLEHVLALAGGAAVDLVGFKVAAAIVPTGHASLERTGLRGKSMSSLARVNGRPAGSAPRSCVPRPRPDFVPRLRRTAAIRPALRYAAVACRSEKPALGRGTQDVAQSRLASIDTSKAGHGSARSPVRSSLHAQSGTIGRRHLKPTRSTAAPSGQASTCLQEHQVGWRTEATPVLDEVGVAAFRRGCNCKRRAGERLVAPEGNARLSAVI